MLNSVTNAMHAAALGIYTFLVYRGLANNEPYFNIWIFLTFLLVFILKIIGVIVHLPMVEKHRFRHNLFWIIISIFLIALNAVTLRALQVGLEIFVLGFSISSILCLLYIRSLFTASGDFYLIASALAFMHLLCALVTHDALRIAWICLIASNILWIILSKIPVLLRNKFHNDIYHLALIFSTYLLYSTIPLGLWLAK